MKKLVLLPWARYQKLQDMAHQNASGNRQSEEEEVPGREKVGTPSMVDSVQTAGGRSTHQPQLASDTDPPLEKRQPQTKPTAPEPAVETMSNSPTSTPLDHHIVNSVQQKVKKKTIQLLNYIHSLDPKEISWNHRGEITYRDQFIPKSNIVDLFRTMVHQNSKIQDLPGAETFAQFLHESNIPLTLLNNKHWLKKLQTFRNVSEPQKGGRTEIVTGLGQQSKTIVKKKKSKKTSGGVRKWISM